VSDKRKQNAERDFLQKLSFLAEQNDPIDQGLYQKYDVKRGLRYADGRGVLVGLTRVGDVVGYEMVNGKKTPIPGKLIYRGYNIEDLEALKSDIRYRSIIIIGQLHKPNNSYGKMDNEVLEIFDERLKNLRERLETLESKYQ